MNLHIHNLLLIELGKPKKAPGTDPTFTLCILERSIFVKDNLVLLPGHQIIHQPRSTRGNSVCIIAMKGLS